MKLNRMKSWSASIPGYTVYGSHRLSRFAFYHGECKSSSGSCLVSKETSLSFIIFSNLHIGFYDNIICRAEVQTKFEYIAFLWSGFESFPFSTHAVGHSDIALILRVYRVIFPSIFCHRNNTFALLPWISLNILCTCVHK